MATPIRAALADPNGNIYRYESEGLPYDDMRSSDSIFGPRFVLSDVSSIEILYEKPLGCSWSEAGFSALGGALFGGLAGAMGMAFLASSNNDCLFYGKIQFEERPETYEFVAHEAVVDRIFDIVEQKRIFGHYEPNNTPIFMRGVDAILYLIFKFLRLFIITLWTLIIIGIVVILIAKLLHLAN